MLAEAPAAGAAVLAVAEAREAVAAEADAEGLVLGWEDGEGALAAAPVAPEARETATWLEGPSAAAPAVWEPVLVGTLATVVGTFATAEAVERDGVLGPFAAAVVGVELGWPVRSCREMAVLGAAEAEEACASTLGERALGETWGSAVACRLVAVEAAASWADAAPVAVAVGVAATVVAFGTLAVVDGRRDGVAAGEGLAAATGVGESAARVARAVAAWAEGAVVGSAAGWVLGRAADAAAVEARWTLLAAGASDSPLAWVLAAGAGATVLACVVTSGRSVCRVCRDGVGVGA